MRVSQQEMDMSHRRIVEGASRLFRERGVRSTSVAEAMGAAGMTHGGFYRHFATKEELVVAAVRAAFDEFIAPLEARQAIESPEKAVAEFMSMYLSPEHVAQPGFGCPLPALAADSARDSGALRKEVSSGLERLVQAFVKAGVGPARRRREQALRQISMLVGAVVLARAVDGDAARELLQACRPDGG